MSETSWDRKGDSWDIFDTFDRAEATCPRQKFMAIFPYARCQKKENVSHRGVDVGLWFCSVLMMAVVVV